MYGPATAKPGSVNLLKYVWVPTKILAVFGLALASTIMVAGLAVWTWYDFSDVLADAETIDRSTAMAMDNVARSSLQAVDGVLESIVGRIERDGIASLATEPGKQALERYARRLPGTGTIYVADSAGNVVAAVPSLRTPINVSDRDWFRSLKDEKVEPLAGQAFRSFPYATGTNTSVDGPPVYLLPALSRALAMVLHELATNAAKYGALSQSGGHVSVRWRQTAALPSAPMLRIEWKETGGPQVSAPTQEGYGSSVIRDLLAFEMAGRVDLVFEADGVSCTIELPANAETVG